MQPSNRRDFLKSSAIAAGASVLHKSASAAPARGSLPTPFPRTLGPNAKKYVQEVLESGLTGAGEMVARFEKAFAKALGVKHCMATPGCTPALAALAAAFALRAGRRDHRQPDHRLWHDPRAGRARTTSPCSPTPPRARSILTPRRSSPASPTARGPSSASTRPGLICDMDPIMELARRHELIVYEDVCQAMFGRYKGRLAGTLAHAAAFSFDSEKTMGSDQGGCVVTNDDKLAERIRCDRPEPRRQGRPSPASAACTTWRATPTACPAARRRSAWPSWRSSTSRWPIAIGWSGS